MRSRRLSLLLIAVAASGLVAQLEAATASSNQKAKGARVFVARPIDNSIDELSRWVGLVAEATFYFKLEVMDGIRVVPFDTVAGYFKSYRDLSEPIFESDYYDIAAKRGISYVILQKYEVSQAKQVSYLVELFSSKDKKLVGTFEKTFPVTELSGALNECLAQFLKTMAVDVNDNSGRFLRLPVLSSDDKALAALGAVIRDERYTKGGGDAASLGKRYADIGNKDKSMLLASYLGALDLIRAKQYVDAAASLDKLLITVGPVYPDWYLLACQGYRESKRYDDALRIAILADKAGVQTPDILVEKARTLQERGDWDKAAEAFQQVLAASPNDPYALTFLAAQSNRGNNFAKALEYADRIIARNGNNGQAYLEKGKALSGLKRGGEAIAALQKAASLLRDDPAPYSMLGDLYAEKKDYANAATAYRKAIAGTPDQLELYLKASRSLQAVKKPKDALDLLTPKESAFSRNAAYQKEMGLLRYALGDTAKAVAALESVMKAGEKDPVVYMALGDMYMSSGKLDAALSMFTQALPTAVDKLTCRMNLGRIYLVRKEPNLAIPHLEQAAGENPKLPLLNRALGDAYLAKGDKPKALGYYIAERQVSGDDVDMQNSIARLSYESGALDKAAAEYTKLLTLDKKNSDAYMKLALISLKQSNVSQAESNLKKGLDLGAAPDASIYITFAETFVAAKALPKAIDAYKKALALKSDNESAVVSLADLYEKTGADSAAAEACLKVFALNNDKYKDYLAKAGKLFEKAKAMGKAKDAYEAFLKKSYTDPAVSLSLARMEYAAKNTKRVVTLLEGVTGTLAMQEDVQMMKAEVNFAQGNFQAALLPLTDVTTKNPANWRAVELCALSAEKVNDVPRATTMYEKSLAFKDLKDKSKDYAFHIGELYESRKMPDQAISRFEKNVRDFPDDPRNYEHLTALYLAAKRTSDAQGILEKAISVQGASPELQKTLAGVLADKGDKSAAARNYQQYLKKNPGDSTALFELGKLYYAQKDFKNATDVLSQASALMPKNFDLHYLLGSAYMELNSLDKAVSPLQRAASINDKETRSLESLAKCFRALKKDDELIDVLKKLTALQPSNFDVFFEVGSLLKAKGKDNGAVGFLETAGKLKPTDVNSNLLLADIHKKQGNDALRVIRLEAALKLAPQNFDANFGLGLYYAGKNSGKKAADYLRAAATIDPKNAEVRYEYAKVLESMNSMAGALSEYKAASQLDSRTLDYLVKVVELSYRTGSKPEAKKNVELALTYKDSEKNGPLQYWAGIIIMEDGKTEQAKGYLEKAVQIDKNCAVCNEYLGDIAMNDGRSADAEKAYSRALEIDPKNDKTSMKLGAVLLRVNQQARAEKVFERAYGENSRNDEALYWLCHIYLQTGRAAQARQVVEQRPNVAKTAWFYLAAGEVAELNGAKSAALNAYATAVRMQPQNAAALSGSGRMYVALEKYEQALEFFGNAMAYDPANPQLLVEMAKCYDGQKNYSAAVELLKEAL